MLLVVGFSLLTGIDEIELTVASMSAQLSAREAASVWVADTARDAQTNKVNSDPNNKNKYISLASSMPPLWVCQDGSGSDMISFPCWASDPTKCTPEWHILLQLSCPVTCQYNYTPKL